MDLVEYGMKAAKTADYSEEFDVIYPALLLSAEVGEVNNIVQKWVRGDFCLVDRDVAEKLKSELGDVLWAWSILVRDLGLNPNEIIGYNLEKLEKRKQDGTIKGGFRNEDG